MQIFINESSLHSQYQNKFEFIESIRVFVKSLNMINEYNKEKLVYKGESFFYSFGMKDVYFETALKSDHTLNELFFQNLQKVNPKSWQKDQKHDMASLYEFKNVCYTSTSTAELAERKIQNNALKGLLLNFNNSIFGESEKIEIDKNKIDKISIDCAIGESDIEKWLIDNKLINPNEEYDESSAIAPLDCQTVLKNSDIFEKTKYPNNNGRKIYRKKDNNQLWVVDSSPRHAGNKAHIEIFDENTAKHLGTSLYNKIDLDTKFKKDERTINKG